MVSSMRRKYPLRIRRRYTGYILMEVILAVAIFALAGISLVTALNNMASVFVKVRKEEEIRRQLETRMVQTRILPLAPMREKSDPDNNGVVYEKEVALLEISNDDKILLPNLYRISVSAFWKEGNVEQAEKAEIYVYQP